MSRVGKQRLAKLVAERAAVSESQARTVIDAVFATIVDELAKGNTVSATGFGSWRTRVHPPRIGRNPKDGSPIDIPARTRVLFKAGAKLRDVTESKLEPEIFFGLGVARDTEIAAALARLFGLDGDDLLFAEAAERFAEALAPIAQQEADEFFAAIREDVEHTTPDPAPVERDG